MDKKNKLKSCPFCGGEAEVIKAHSSFSLPYTVVCTSEECGASVGKFRRTREEAIEVWNTRKPIEKIIEQLEEEEIVKQEDDKVDDKKCMWYKIHSNVYKSNKHAKQYDSRVMDWNRCPYCSKKIKVVE